jgi:hypothetical protein
MLSSAVACFFHACSRPESHLLVALGIGNPDYTNQSQGSKDLPRPERGWFHQTLAAFLDNRVSHYAIRAS